MLTNERPEYAPVRYFRKQATWAGRNSEISLCIRCSRTEAGARENRVQPRQRPRHRFFPRKKSAVSLQVAKPSAASPRHAAKEVSMFGSRKKTAARASMGCARGFRAMTAKPTSHAHGMRSTAEAMMHAIRGQGHGSTYCQYRPRRLFESRSPSACAVSWSAIECRWLESGSCSVRRPWSGRLRHPNCGAIARWRNLFS